MKSGRFINWVFITLLFSVSINLFGQKSYYVSSLNGNDGNAGTSSAAPWKTMSRLQQVLPTLSAGDVVYLQRGSIWHETSLVLNSRGGTESAPIVFKAYGEGPRPVLSGSTVISSFEQSGNVFSASVYKDFPQVPLCAPTGILINGDWKDIARSREFIVQGSGSNSYIYAGEQAWAANRYVGSLILMQPVHWHWTPSPITANTSNSISFMPVQHSSSTGQEAAFYLVNHDDFLKDPGDWVFKNRQLKVYFPTDLNQENVQFAVSDSIVSLLDCSNISFQDLVFEMSNHRFIAAFKGSNIKISGCEFRYTAGEAVMFRQTNGIYFTGNYIHDCGAVGLRLKWFGYAEVRNNLFKRIATEHVGLANYDFRMGAAINLNYCFSPNYYVEYNYFDSVGLAIQSFTFSEGGSASIRYNYIENYGMTISDCGAIYFNSDMGSEPPKYVENNFIRNAITAGYKYSTNFHPVLHPHAIYCDEGAMGYYCNRNTIDNTSYALYMNRNLKNTMVNNNIVNANQDNPEFFNAVFMKDQAIGAISSSADRDSIRNNNIVLGTGSNPSVYLRHESEESHNAWVDQNIFYFDYNKIAAPFQAGTPDIGRYILHWGHADYNYTIERMQADGGNVSSIPTDVHSVINPQGIKYASVSSLVSQEDFVKLFTNYSAGTRTVNLGNAIFRDMNGSTISGSVSIPPFYSRILFYQSGNLSTVDPEDYFDSSLIPALVIDDNGYANHAPVINNREFVINESTQTTLVVGTVPVYDQDDIQGHSFVIVSGNSSGLFKINNSGTISFTTSDIPYAGNPVYTLTIRVTDNGNPPLSDEATISIKLVELEANIAPILENQTFEFYEDQTEGIFIGHVVAHDPDNDLISYEIISGENMDLFAVDASTGALFFNQIPGDTIPATYELLIRVTDNGVPELSDDALITVVFIPLRYAVFIDPSASVDGDGSYSSPYRSFETLEFKEDHSYLIKRGTELSVDRMTFSSGNIEIGAYGQGELPVIKSASTSFVFFSADQGNISIRDLKVEADQALSIFYFVGPKSDNIRITNCVLSGAEYGLRFINTGTTITEYCRFINNHTAAYVVSSSSHFYYNIFANNFAGISMVIQNSSSNVYNNVFYNNREAVDFKGLQLNLRNNIICLTSETDRALKTATEEVKMDHNIYFPERKGFVSLGNYSYNTLDDLNTYAAQDLNSLVVDPVFLFPGQDDFNLASHSPAIDAGIYVGLNYDMNGIPIPVGHAPDIGINEFDYNQTGTIDTVDDLAESPYWSYPNPASSLIFVNANEEFSGRENLRIINSFGQVVTSVRASECQVDNQRCYVDISSLNPGLYLISISDENILGTVRFIKGN
ncbi:MAG: cadherin domain-containing protein [Bacteroidales bacterium]|nr:cadherin domain-containing protein [Bacteroidales bacterium]